MNHAAGIVNARYKGVRCRDPLRMTDKYAVIDEIVPLPIYEVASDADADAKAIQTWEPRVKINQFTPSSPLLNAFFTNYAQFRVRSVTVSFSSLNVDNVNPRYEVGVYWIPNHYMWDYGQDVQFSNWIDFKEKNRCSIVSRNSGDNGFTIRYVPQLSQFDDVEEDEAELPPADIAIRSTGKSGWLPTTDQFKDFEFRGPMMVFRKPYAAIPTTSRVWSRTVRCVFEFRQAKTGV